MSPRPSARYLVGIDLGTTHTVVAYCDTAAGRAAAIQLFPIEQLVAPGEVAACEMLPSVRYHPATGELNAGDLRLPWAEAGPSGDPPVVLGEWARSLGAGSHGRLVSSAKSWLSHPAVDRTAPILPWGAPEGVLKVSPVEASASYLVHVRSAWNHRFPEAPLERQDLVVTIPASFDEGARALTLQAAQRAGLPAVRLLEEPQAACYDWLWEHARTRIEQLAEVRLILVCDVGGGTTDFTLIRVDRAGGEPVLTRIGVGNHLMLGGDNMDLTLAHRIEDRLDPGGRRLSGAELAQLVDQCRRTKERLLGREAPESATVTVLGAGSRLIGGARSVQLDRAELLERVLDGFFPGTGRLEYPERKRSAVVEFGLPYAADPAITRHLAAFLAQQAQVSAEAGGKEEEGALPDAVLLNGGVFRSELIADRLMDTLQSWGGGPVKRLCNDRPEHAVAFGAVAYSLARRGMMARIGGGSARSFFLLLDAGEAGERQGVCVLPRGTEEGREVALTGRRFVLKLGRPVRFHLFSSTMDTDHRPGDLAVIDPERFTELPPLAVAFDQGTGDRAVRLIAMVTEIGTLELHCVAEDDSSRRWNVEFLLRNPGAGAGVPRDLPPQAGRAAEQIRLVFGKKVKHLAPTTVKGLRQALEKSLGARASWNTGLCRSLFTDLLEGLPHRRRSADHERLWLNLSGYCLRPGFGDPVDDWRIAQIRPIYAQGLQFVNEAQNWAEWWTFWRRIAGGLPVEAQAEIFRDLAPFIDPAASRRGNLGALAKKRGYEDMVRLAASLERLGPMQKVALGQWLLQRLAKPGEPGESWWALGRVGSRVPFHGSAHDVVPRDSAEEWLHALLAMDWRKNPSIAFAATLIARKSGDRDRDIPPAVVEEVVAKLRGAKAPDSWVKLVSEVQQLDAAEEKRVFGEALPPGLTLMV